jgi:diguanylate cyclase (GGDEF)-like protein
MKLSAKLFVSFSLIVLAIGGASFWALVRFQRNVLEDEITAKLEDLAVPRLDIVDRTLAERLDDVAVLGYDAAFAFPATDAARLHAVLAGFLARHPGFAAVSLYDWARVKVASAGAGIDNLGVRHALNEYWPAVYAGKDLFVDVSVSTSLQVPTIHLVHTIGHGKERGVLVARIPLAKLFDVVGGGDEDIDRNPARYRVDLLDDTGLVLYSNHATAEVFRARDPEYASLRPLLAVEGRVGSLAHVHRSGRQRQIRVFAKQRGFGKYAGNGWLLMVEVEAREAFAPVTRFGQRMALVFTGILVAGSAAIFGAIFFLVVRPLRRLSEATVRFGRGELAARVVVSGDDEIGVLAAAFNDMAAKIGFLAQHDGLTGLPNRALFVDRLRQALALARRDAARVALLFIDLDRFKAVNDTLGHEAGDRLLRAAAVRMQACVREADSVARLGGDEFVILLPRIESAEGARTVAEKLRRALGEPFDVGGREASVSASIGVALYPDDAGDETALLARADAAMYAAKRAGRNTVC